jgi:hypothetical protein
MQQEEEERIRGLGGFVSGDIGRVNGLLAVSRSFGDFCISYFLLLPVPAFSR